MLVEPSDLGNSAQPGRITFDSDRRDLALFPGETTHDTSFLRYYSAPYWLMATVCKTCDGERILSVFSLHC
jgi:hypothetical protein